MPSRKSAILEIKKAKKRQLRNTERKKVLKIEEKQINALLAAKDVDKLKKAAPKYVARVDKAVGQKIMHKNKASRKKALVLKKINKLTAV